MHALLLMTMLVGDHGAEFRPQTVDDKVQIGYGIAIGDVDGDGRPDIVLADKRAFRWYQNPSWKPHVLTDNLTPRDNVCLAARDIDGDGKVEIAVGALWNPGDTVNSGSVHYLVPPADRAQRWKPVKLHHEPTVHRMRWVQLRGGKHALVVAPLHGRGNRNGTGEGVRLLAYHPPADPRDDWKTELIDDSLHMTHNFDVGQWDTDSDGEEIVYIGKEGALLLRQSDDGWQREKFDRVPGGGEIRMGVRKGDRRFLATIEPMHGETLALYPSPFRGRGPEPTRLTNRIVLDSGLKQGHAVAIGDLLALGEPQIVAGWRNPNADGIVGVKLYYRDEGKWASQLIDNNTMAAEDLRLADLNGDGRLDIIAAGRATKNLKIYWNELPKK